MSRLIVFQAANDVGRFLTSTNTSNRGIDPMFPQNDLDFAAEGGREVAWTIQVRRILGSPTNWKIEARFLRAVPSTAGVLMNYPDEVPFDEVQTLADVRGGVGIFSPVVPAGERPEHAGEWGVIASSTHTPSINKMLSTDVRIPVENTVTITRRVKVSEPRHLLEIRGTADGASVTSDGFQIVVTAEVLT